MDAPSGVNAPTDAEQRRMLIDLLVQEVQQRSHSAASPGKEPRAVIWLKGLMPTFIAIFGFGGQITFTVIPTIIRDDDVPSAWGAAEVRTFLSLAWMFFTLGFGLSCAAALTYAYGGDTFTERLDSGFYEKIVSSVCALLQLFAALAFFFLSLVVAAYTPAVGWLVFGISCLGILLAVGVFILDTWFYHLWRVMFRIPPDATSSAN